MDLEVILEPSSMMGEAVEVIEYESGDSEDGSDSLDTADEIVQKDEGEE